MKLDREIQLELLRSLADSYPNYIGDAWYDLAAKHGSGALRANAIYLSEHGLVRMDTSPSGFAVWITASGLDFLADDGGLSAILGVVTVKLHADTIKGLIEARIDASAASHAEKSALKKHLSTLSSEAMKTLAKSLVEKGLQNVPDVVQWLHTLLPHA